MCLNGPAVFVLSKTKRIHDNKCTKRNEFNFSGKQGLMFDSSPIQRVVKLQGKSEIFVKETMKTLPCNCLWICDIILEVY